MAATKSSSTFYVESLGREMNWDEFGAYYRDQLIKNLEPLLPKFLFAKRRGRVFIQRLEQIGFVFRQSSIAVPSLAALSSGFENLLRQRLAEFPNLGEDDLILPGFAFRKGPKEWIFRRFGEDVPPGYTIWTHRLVPGRGLYPSLSAGIFPLVVNFVQIHDLFGHQFSYIESPLYMAGYKRVVRRLMDVGGWDLVRAQTDSSLYFRIQHYNEHLALVSPAALMQHKEILPPNWEEMLTRVTKVQEIKGSLQRLSNDRLNRMAIDLVEALPDVVVALGGRAYESQFDGSSPLIFREREEISKILESKIFNVPSFYTNRELKTRLIEKVASVQTLLIAVSKTSLDDWIAVSMPTPPDPDSNLMRQLSDLGFEKSPFFGF